jgi:hypothetical protein
MAQADDADTRVMVRINKTTIAVGRGLCMNPPQADRIIVVLH